MEPRLKLSKYNVNNSLCLRMSLLCLAVTLILIILRINVTEKVSSQKMLYFHTSPRLTIASALYLRKCVNAKIASFHSNVVLLHCQTSISRWLNLFSLVTCNSCSCYCM